MAALCSNNASDIKKRRKERGEKEDGGGDSVSGCRVVRRGRIWQCLMKISGVDPLSYFYSSDFWSSTCGSFFKLRVLYMLFVFSEKKNVNHKAVQNYVRTWMLVHRRIPRKQLWVALHTIERQTAGKLKYVNEPYSVLDCGCVFTTTWTSKKKNKLHHSAGVSHISAILSWTENYTAEDQHNMIPNYNKGKL